MQIGLVCGESAGLISIKKILNIKKIKITFIVSANKEYDNLIKNICSQNKIIFIKKDEFKKKKIRHYLKNVDYLLSIFSNIIVPEDYLKLPRKMCVNLHPAILPFYKGINVISGVIYNKERTTGLTLHKMEKKIDAGKILLIKKINVNNYETALSLINKLKKKVPGLISLFFKKIMRNNKILLRPNNSNLFKRFPKYIPNNGLINLNDKALKIIRIFKASFYGPYTSSWGGFKIKINNKYYLIKDIRILERKNKLREKIKKINENIFICKSKDKILKITI